MNPLSTIAICCVLLAGCASRDFRGYQPREISTNLAGRKIVIQTKCPERITVRAAVQEDFQSSFSPTPKTTSSRTTRPVQKPIVPLISTDDTTFLSYVRKAFLSSFYDGTFEGKLEVDRNHCNFTNDSAPIWDNSRNVGLWLDTSDLDTSKVYLARTNITFDRADQSMMYSDGLGHSTLSTSKFLGAYMNYGLFDPKTKKLFVSGSANGLSTTSIIFIHVITHGDWQNATEKLADDLRSQIEKIIKME
jgi:hypothetical protein